jgi:hypothetical protein
MVTNGPTPVIIKSKRRVLSKKVSFNNPYPDVIHEDFETAYEQGIIDASLAQHFNHPDECMPQHYKWSDQAMEDYKLGWNVVARLNEVRERKFKSSLDPIPD